MSSRLRAAVVVLGLVLAACSNVTTPRTGSDTNVGELHAASAFVPVPDPSVGPHARDEARHASDKLTFHPAVSPIVPLRTQAPIGGSRIGVLASRVGPAAANPGHVQREVMAFAPYWSLAQASSWNYSMMTTLAYFGLDMNQYGGFLNTGAGWNGWNSSDFTTMVNLAHRNGDRVTVTIKLFHSDQLNVLLTSEQYRQTAVGATINMIASRGLDGVTVDFEGDNGCSDSATMESQCTYPDLQAGMVTFMTELSGSVHARWPAALVSMATYSGAASWDMGIFKIDALAPVVDAFFIMAYDMAFSDYPGHAAPNAPMSGFLYNDTLSVSQYLTKAPASKIILAVPYYGYVYCTVDDTPYSSVTRNSYGTPLCPDGTSWAVAETYAGAKADIACKAQNMKLRWDTTALSPYATWYSPISGDPCDTNKNSWRELYYDDVQSLGVKYDLINANNLRGAGIWALGYDGGAPELWNLLAVKFAYIPSAPDNVTAYAQDGAAGVSWSPSISLGGAINSYTVTASPGGATTTVAGWADSAMLYGLTNGTSYTLTVTGSNAYGPGVISAPSNPVAPAKPVYSAAFPWYDRATPGFQSDYFAVSNPTQSWANVLILLPGTSPLSFGVAKGSAKYVTLPPGAIGGPVLVSADNAVLVSQRAVFDNSFEERAAVPTASWSTNLSFPWYDWATPGFGSDYFYVGNPGGTAANVSISLPGATPLMFSVPAGGAAFKTFPHGTIGGPVKLTSDQPVTASQRVLYGNSFNEIPAGLPAAASTSLVFPWYDWASPDFGSDYFYVANPGVTAASVTVKLPGATPLVFSVGAGAATFKTFPHGTVGGPVMLTSDQPILASQRSLFDGNFTEVAASLATSESMSQHFPWYDWANPDLQSDYFYVANPGPNWANVLISIPGQAVLSFGVPHGTTKAMTLPRGAIGGPVTVTADQPILISQRVVFDSMFQEFSAPAS